MEIIKVLIVTTIILTLLGILSLRKPDIVGADFYWSKYKWFYIPKYKKATNKYYQHQIKIIGIALIMSAVILLVFMITCAIYPPILSVF
ncbi:hypothetical protein [Clostridium cellulovorans]|uniref:Uncharacterized protein n=1 Tax=Clostridium cellulovorans (strain ATCC 35296 / DSM 3052 / OCM 3 / 743B) TaxID=573061 RepID=D9SPT1_CLOC7|nr:hypothetical protein [Clostridium cellulovorans]ADL52067.1 hypothetical protein Clocel_2350 [Clostridium cellulovorans 743B]